MSSLFNALRCYEDSIWTLLSLQALELSPLGAYRAPFAGRLFTPAIVRFTACG